MQTRHTLRLGGLLLFLGLATLYGCSTVPPTAPPPVAGDAEPTFVRVAEAAVDSAGQPVPANPKVVSVKIDGDKGGNLRNGRFDLEVAAGAWEGNATITMTVPDPAVMQCQLTIDPPDANHFKALVMLYGHCQNPIGASSTGEMVFIWQDEMTWQWKAVEGSSSSGATGLVSAALEHFSNYGVVQGKAGW